MKLLFVDDEPDVLEPVIEALSEQCRCEVRGFDDAEDALFDISPDIVVLDLLDGGATSEAENLGSTTYRRIWETRFCPIIVYSAQPELLSDKEAEHPFVRYVKKGATSVGELREGVKAFEPHADAVRHTEQRIRSEISSALRDVSREIFEHYQSDEDRSNAIVRSAQRRLAALMDDLSRHGEKLQGWEQFVSPPIGSDLCLGDIIRKAEGSPEDPRDFFVVLTPSCDLVCSNGRQPRVSDVLVAGCESLPDAIGRSALKGMSQSKLKGRIIGTMLSPGFFGEFLPIPTLTGRIPSMAANFKRLHLLPVSHVVSETPEYERIASIDSPFRELVSWGYLQTSCRPGLPDRDFELWRDEILEVLKAKEGD
ncbi:hypothetical protein NHH03_23640 [Stieleria sp. TO1_6]|nr:hypothetical protein [Stieleria tagensis]